MSQISHKKYCITKIHRIYIKFVPDAKNAQCIYSISTEKYIIIYNKGTLLFIIYSLITKNLKCLGSSVEDAFCSVGPPEWSQNICHWNTTLW